LHWFGPSLAMLNKPMSLQFIVLTGQSSQLPSEAEGKI
jgi:hypothetical protein